MSNGCVRQLKLSSRESRKLLIKSEADARHCGLQYVLQMEELEQLQMLFVVAETSFFLKM